MNHSKGNWKAGNGFGSVVTDNHDGFRNPENGIGVSSGHSDVDYYGGYLICESVMKVEDQNLIAAAPDMLEALLEMKRVYEEKGQLLAFNVSSALRAINKALGGTDHV